MLLSEFDLVNEKIMDPREAIIRRAMEIIDQDMKNDPRKTKALERYAFDVWRAVGLKNMTPRDLVALYRDWKGVTEGVGRITAQNKTADVGYDAITKEAAKFGNKVDRDGRPPLLRINESIESIDTGKDDKFGIKFEDLKPGGKRLGTIGGLIVYDTPNLGWGMFGDVYSGIVLWDPKAKQAAGVLSRKREYSASKFHPTTFLISVAAVAPGYEGRGLMHKLYVFLIRKGFALASDDTQSRGGRKLWERLAQTAGITVYAIDEVNGEFVYSAVDPDDIADANFMVYDSDRDQYFKLKKEVNALFDKKLEIQDKIDDMRYAPAADYDETSLKKAEEERAVVDAEIKAAKEELSAWDKHTDTGRHSRLMAVAAKKAANESKINEGEYPLEDWNDWEGDRQYREQGAKIVSMTPEEYLARVRPLTMDPESEENIDLLVAHVKAGGRLDPLKIYANGKEDGRHRAYAAQALGIKRVPVVLWPQLNESRLVEDAEPTKDEIEEWLASVEYEMEEVDNLSMRDDPEPELERDYQALHAVEMVLRNHLTALRNPVLMDQSIFLYNMVTDAVQYAALHIVINGDVAELKWLGNLGRKGVGSKLLHDGLTLAKARGAKRAKLTTKWNSEGFYLKSGFKADGETTSNAFSGSNNTEMSKTLESFDSPRKLKWNGDSLAYASLPDGSDLTVEFDQIGKSGNYHVAFQRNDSMEVTGDGLPMQVFATVLSAINQFVAKNNPTSMFFYADKPSKADKNSTKGYSRDKLYARMINKFAPQIGMTPSIIDKYDHVEFRLNKKDADQINEIESVTLGKDWGEVSRWRWNGKNSDRVFKIGRVAGLNLVIEKANYKGSMTAYLMNKEGDAVGEIQLEKEYNAWITDTTILKPEYQGQGLMLQAYVVLLKAGMILRSGGSQSAGGKKIWLALNKQPGITVYAGKEGRDGEWQYSAIDDDEVDDRARGAFDIYDIDNYDVDNEYKSEVFALQARADKLSAKALKAGTPELKAKFTQEYKEVSNMLDKLEDERIVANRAQRAKDTARDWENTYLFAVADGVEPNNRF